MARTRAANTTGETIAIRHPDAWSGDLSIGESVYPVVEGVTVIPVEDLPAALQSGFVVDQGAAPGPVEPVA